MKNPDQGPQLPKSEYEKALTRAVNDVADVYVGDIGRSPFVSDERKTRWNTTVTKNPVFAEKIGQLHGELQSARDIALRQPWVFRSVERHFGQVGYESTRSFLTLLTINATVEDIDYYPDGRKRTDYRFSEVEQSGMALVSNWIKHHLGIEDSDTQKSSLTLQDVIGAYLTGQLRTEKIIYAVD